MLVDYMLLPPILYLSPGHYSSHYGLLEVGDHPLGYFSLLVAAVKMVYMNW